MNSPVAPPDLLDDVATIPLPETRRTGRNRREQRRRRQRRQRSLRFTAAVAAAVLLVVGVVGRFVSHVASDDDRGGGKAASGAAAPPAPAVLIAQRDGGGQVVSLFLVAPGSGGKGGTLVLLPPGAMAEVASLDIQPLGQVLALGGPERLRATVQNLLGTAVGAVHVLDDAALAALVAPAAPLRVDMPERVEQVDARGTVQVLFPSGPVDVPAPDVPRLLAEQGRGSDLGRLARHQAFWEAWLAKVEAAPGSLPPEPAALVKALRAFAAGPVRVRVLPVDPLGTDATGRLYQVDRAELAVLRAELVPGGDGTAAAGRPTVQILNGTGAVQLAQQVADRLGPAVEVKLTGNAARFDYAETQVVFYDRAEQAQAQRVRDALGVGKLVFSRNPLDVVDVTIIVGKDFK